MPHSPLNQRSVRQWLVPCLFVLFCCAAFSLYVACFSYFVRSQRGLLSPSWTGTMLSSICSAVLGHAVTPLRFVNGKDVIAFFVSFAAASIIGLSLVFHKTGWLRLLCRYRWPIGCAALVLMVAFQLNGTGQSCLSAYASNSTDLHPLFGLCRYARSDEWGVWTPMALSQHYCGYPAVSPLIAGGGVSSVWSSVGGLPAWSLAAPFKPLYWGFLLADLFGLDFGYGLSFLWVSRLILGFLITFEFGMYLTGQNRSLGCMLAFMVVFSPYVQWWFSQSVCEVVFFSEAILIVLWKYADAPGCGRRAGYAALVAWLMGCLIMIAYPAWIIPQIYVTLVLGIIILVAHRGRRNGGDAVTLLIPLLVLLAYLFLIALSTADTLQAVRNSDYPGQRLYTGKSIPPGGIWSMASGLFALFPADNVCSLSRICSFAPAGGLLTLDVLLLQKKRDGILLSCLIMETLFTLVIVLGIPSWLAKITLLSQCTRLVFIIGILDLFCLVRALSSTSRAMRIPAAIALSVLCMAFQVFAGRSGISADRLLPTLLFCGAVSGIVSFLIFRYRTRWIKPVLSLTIMLVMLACGAFVNPIELGIRNINRLDVVKAIQSVDAPADAVWITTGGFPHGNLALLAGKVTPFSTHEYADVGFWRFFDPEGAHIDLYNSFLHVETTISDRQTGIVHMFSGNVMEINIHFKDLVPLGIDYVAMDMVQTDSRLKQIAKVGAWRVYEVQKPF